MKSTTVGTANKRDPVIDGIRGWAALIVLIFHMTKEPFGIIFPELKETWALAPISGDLAVFVFFILSGDALSSAFLRNGRESQIDRMLIKRYFRLSIPVLMSCLIVFIIMKTGFDYHFQAAEVLHKEDWLGAFLHIDANIPRFLKFCLIDVYTKPSKTESFNPFLWTMSVEMVGSLLVFVTCYVWKALKWPLPTLIVATLYFMVLGTHYSLFLVGMLIAYTRETGHLQRIVAVRLVRLSLILAPILAIITIHLMRHIIIPIALSSALATLVVLSFYSFDPFRQFFSNKLSQYFGEISFPLYLVHFSVLISFTSFFSIEVLAQRNSPSEEGLRLALVVGFSCMISILLAHGFRKLERRALKQVDLLLNKALISR